MEARRKFVEPIGAWFTQIGGLHTVFHIWQYPSLEERKKTRDRAWEVDTWSGTVSEVSVSKRWKEYGERERVDDDSY